MERAPCAQGGNRTVNKRHPHEEFLGSVSAAFPPFSSRDRESKASTPLALRMNYGECMFLNQALRRESVCE